MNIFDQKKSFVLRKIYDSLMNIFDQKKLFVLRKIHDSFLNIFNQKPSILFHALAQPREGFICVYFLPHRVAPYISRKIL